MTTMMPKICWDVLVSFSMLAVPLHALGDDGWDWAAGASFSFGLPESPPQPRALPTVAEVVAAFTSAGCHGQAWFTVQAPGASGSLPPCPDPGQCAERGGLDLGEVSLAPGDSAVSSDRLAVGTRVKSIGFRKPYPAAVLAAVATLTAAAGSMLVFDDNADQVFVINEGDQPASLAAHWPW